MATTIARILGTLPSKGLGNAAAKGCRHVSPVFMATARPVLFSASRARFSSTRPRKWRRRFGKLLKYTLGFVLAGTAVYYSWKFVEKATRPTFPNEKKKKVVILGSGWGAMSVLNHLNPGQFEVTVVSPRNYFLFTPIVPSATVGTVDCRSIVEPIRRLILKHHRGHDVQFHEASCVEILPEKKQIVCRDESGIQGAVAQFNLEYDILVSAVGATNNTFRTPGVEENCYFLKEITDARIVRDAIIDLVESSCMPGQPVEERRRLLHFVVVGGGPTGVEFASELRDFLREDLPRIYPHVTREFQVTLVQSGDHILNTYDQQISAFTERNFKSKEQEIKVLTGTRVVRVGRKEVTFMDKQTGKHETIPCGMCVWSTGVAPRPLILQLMNKIPEQKTGRALLTDGFLRVKGAEGIFALGDCSTIAQEKMLGQADKLFQLADVNKDGTLSIEEFCDLMEKAKREFPQVQLLFSKAEKNVHKFFAEMDTSGDQRLDIEEFKQTLRVLDRQLKSLPATAQVASQQGKYLGKLLSRTNGNITTQSPAELEKKGNRPFVYRHLGSFAYVGNNQAVLEVPVLGALNGWWVMWLWRAAYASECASFRTKFLLVMDWTKSYIFGRDTSRI